MSLLDTLNESCVESGVCPHPKMIRAAELWRDGSHNKILLGCWSDGHVTSCVVQATSEQRCCYSAADGGEELFEHFRELLTSPNAGYQMKEIEVEGD